MVTFTFDSSEAGNPYSATVRLTGRRAGVAGQPKPSDSFVREDRIARLVPGSGPVTVTSTIEGIPAGEWSVSAELVRDSDDSPAKPARRSRSSKAEPLRTANWSWRHWSVVPGPAVAVAKTRLALLTQLAAKPAVIVGSLPLLVAIGGIIALVIQVAILAGRGQSVAETLLVSIVASLAGLAAAKAWHAVLNPREPILKPGWAVDGFLVVAPIVAVVMLLALQIPVGEYLDATTPGLFFAVALGRAGCFLTGCCGGRTTSSRWAIWSSDGRIGARRIPTQLLESATGLVLGVMTLALVVGRLLPVDGAVFVGAFIAYFSVRQTLIRYRASPRRYLWQRGGNRG